MRFVFPLIALALAACGQTTAPAPETSATTTEAPEATGFVGHYEAMSNTAMSITGALDLAPDVLSFDKGFRMEGARTEAMLTADTDLSAGGGTARDVTGNTGILNMEVRHVDLVRVAADARDPQLCGAGRTVSYVIVAHGTETLSLLVFSGAEAPGPNAHDSQLCGTFNYMASAAP
ncbi:MAG: hypothetical protein ABL871_05725 [Terricaulis sp.]